MAGKFTRAARDRDEVASDDFRYDLRRSASPMSRKLLRLIIALILGLACATQAGCLVVAAAAGTGAGVAYVRGDLDATVDASPVAAADATERAFKELDLHVISRESTALDAKLVA